MLMIKQLIISITLIGYLLLLPACKPQQKQSKTPAKTKQTKTSQTVKTTQTGITSGEKMMEQKLGLSSKEIHRERIYSFVNEWYGVPYKYGGCKKEGVDCSCFATILYNEVYHISLNRTAGEMFKASEQIQANEAKQGDLFFFKINGDKITHVGVCLKNNFFVHASTSQGVIINSIEEAYYKKYFFCAGRIKKT